MAGEVERWLPIPGWETYDVSDRGRVRRVWKGSEGWRLLRPAGREGYLRVRLVRRGERRRWRSVHRLVLLAFVGSCPPGQQCRHLDGVRTNNTLGNLAWGFPAQNTADKALYWTGAGGRGRPMPDDVVRRARELRREGWAWREISALLGWGCRTVQRRVAALER